MSVVVSSFWSVTPRAAGRLITCGDSAVARRVIVRARCGCRYACESVRIARTAHPLRSRSDIHVHEGIEVLVGVAEKLLEAPLVTRGGRGGAELCIEAEAQAG